MRVASIASGPRARTLDRADRVPAADHRVRRDQGSRARRRVGDTRRLRSRARSSRCAELRTQVGVLQRATEMLKRVVEQSRRQPAQSAGTGRRRRDGDLERGRRRLQVRRLRGRSFAASDDASSKNARAPMCRCSPALATCSTSAAAAASFWRRSRTRGVTRARVDTQHRNGRGRARARARRDGAPTRSAISSSLPDESLGGIIATQVVEHLEPSYLMRLLDAAAQKLRAGRADRARDDQPGVLARVLQQLHPRLHARPPGASRDAAVPAARQRLRAGGDSVQRAGARAHEDENGRSPGRGARLGRAGVEGDGADRRTP